MKKSPHSTNPDIMMEIRLPDTVQVNLFEKSGVPWQNVVGFVSHNLVTDLYRKMITDSADIIEADLAIEAGLSLVVLNNEHISSSGF